MDQLFPKAVYFGGMAVQIIVRMPYSRQARRRAKTDRRITLSERGLLAVLSLSMGILPLIYSLTRWLGFADFHLSPNTKVRANSLGTLLVAASLWLFWRSHRDLGANWSPSLEIGEQQTLSTQGVYGSIRHPMYASQVLYALGQALLFRNWIAGPAGLLTSLLMYLIRVPREEQMMLDHFGEAYRAYSARTGRILPRIVCSCNCAGPGQRIPH